MKTVLERIVRTFSSLGLCCVLLILLGLLTWLGTLEQVNHGLHEVQKKYFESFFLVHWVGVVPIPLPGANLVLCLLFVNVIVGGIVRLRRRWAVAGNLVTHIGIAVMLLSGFVKMYFSEDGHVTLFEKRQANYFQSYHRWEIAIREELGNGRVKEHLVPQEDFWDATGSEAVTLVADELPFDLQVSHYMTNSRPLAKGPMFKTDVPVVDGVFLLEQRSETTSERNIAGAYVTIVGKWERTRQQGILWGAESAPLTVKIGDRRWAVSLRKERYPMPFMLRLDKFTKEDHPRLNMPKAFSSDVTLIQGETQRPIKISMNKPLREQGLVLFQASWGPSNARPGDRLFSTFAVVRNPADQMPLYACIIIALGLIMHFWRKLVRYIRNEARKA